MVALYLQFCQVFGESVVYPYHEFMQLPYATIIDIVKQRSKINEENMRKREEEIKKSQSSVKRK